MERKHKDRYLRDFIYLDLALVGSYLEQLIGGLPYEAKISREQQAGGDAGVNVALFHVDLKGGGTRGYAENQTIQWATYARLEDELRKANKLLDFTSSAKTFRVEPHVIFLFKGVTKLEPDWADWNSGISLAKIVIDKLNQLGAIESMNQAQPDENGMVPMLLGPGGNAIVALQKNALSELLPKNLPKEPPSSIRRLFKPTAVRVTFPINVGKEKIEFEGSASLHNFTPHRLNRYTGTSAQDDVNVLGLVTEIIGSVLRFVPLAIFVKL